jgi:hypothetical protein
MELAAKATSAVAVKVTIPTFIEVRLLAFVLRAPAIRIDE